MGVVTYRDALESISIYIAIATLRDNDVDEDVYRMLEAVICEIHWNGQV